MKYYLTYILLLFLLSCTSSEIPQEEIKAIYNKLEQGRDSNMLRGIHDALEDIKKESSKYYDCNITKIDIEMIDKINTDYNVTFINNNCPIENYVLGYNYIIDSVLLHYYGVNMQEIIKQ